GQVLTFCALASVVSRLYRAFGGETPASALDAPGCSTLMFDASVRLVLGLVTLSLVVPATLYFTFWMQWPFVPGTQAGWLGKRIISCLCAAGLGWYAWKAVATRRTDSPVSGPAPFILFWGVIIGAVSFDIELFGSQPWISYTHSLARIFVSWPVGALAGALLGAMRWTNDERVQDATPVLKWVAGIWVVTLLTTRFFMGQFPTKV